MATSKEHMLLSKEHMGLIIGWDGHEQVLVVDGDRVIETHKVDQNVLAATRVIEAVGEELSATATAMEVVREFDDEEEAIAMDEVA